MRCPASCCLHVYFSNVGLVIKPDELMLWLATVKSLYTGHAPAAAHEADTQHIRLHSPVDGLVLLFSRNELEWLNDLIKSARLVLEAERILANNQEDGGPLLKRGYLT